MSLYNEVRPRLLSEVKGQDAIKQQLSAMFETKKIPNAMLFIGPRGTGKTTVARIVSRYVNCEGDGPEPCGGCPACKAILNGSYIDVVELDAASHNGVSDVHQIIEQTQFAPQGKYKIFILDEVHMFSDSAWNALLKTLEEPPKGVIFILCTTEEHKVPATIISRCRRFHFEKISLPVIVEAMKEVCDKYGKAYEKDALTLIARASDGCMRDALSILESFFDVDGLCVDTVVSTLGTSREDVIFNILSGISQGNVSSALEALRESDRRGVSLKALVKSLMMAVTDTMYLIQGADISCISNSESYKQLLVSYAEAADIDRMLSLSKRLSECYATISRVDDGEFLVESAIIDAIDTESRIAMLENRITELEKRSAVIQKSLSVNTEEPWPIEAVKNHKAKAVIDEVPDDFDFFSEEDDCPFVEGYQALFDEPVSNLKDDNPTMSPSDIARFNNEIPEDIPFDEDNLISGGNMRPIDVSALPAGTAIAGTISLSDLTHKVEQKEKKAVGAEDAGTAVVPMGNILSFGPGGFSGLL